MDIGQIITRIMSVVDGYDESVAESVDDPFLMQAIGDAVLEIKRELKRPISEKTVTLTTGERGFTLPSDWYDWAGEEVTAMRLDPLNHSSEGSIITLIPEYSLEA